MTSGYNTAAAPTLDDLMARLRGGFVETAETQAVFKHLADVVMRADILNARSVPRSASITLIEGPHLCGKSRTVTEFINRQSWQPAQAVSIDLPVQASCKALTQIFFAALDEPAARLLARRDPYDTDEIEKRLNERGVKLIIVDRADALLRTERPGEELEGAEWLVRLLERTGVPTVLIANEGFFARLKAAPALRRRIDRRLMMKRYEWATDRAMFRYVLAEFERILGLPAVSDLQRLPVAEGVHRVSDGLMGPVTKLLETALRMADRENLDRIREEDLYKAVVWSNADVRNPFRQAS